MVPKFINPAPNVFIFIGYTGHGGAGNNGDTYFGDFRLAPNVLLGKSRDFLY
jgi:hypothetical protein